MSSITTAVAADYRLQQWAQLVKECQNRPFDMTVEQWYDTKGISKSNYYISRGQYLKRAYTRRTEKAPAGQRKAIGGSLFCVGKREKEGWTYRRKE